MPGQDIRVPKEVRGSIPGWVQETVLGHPRGAMRQYRHGNLHIREYGDHFMVHTDRADPRKDPRGHLVMDAPEVLAGIACAAAGGLYGAGRAGTAAARIMRGAACAAAAGYLGYRAAGWAKGRLP